VCGTEAVVEALGTLFEQGGHAEVAAVAGVVTDAGIRECDGSPRISFIRTSAPALEVPTTITSRSAMFPGRAEFARGLWCRSDVAWKRANGFSRRCWAASAAGRACSIASCASWNSRAEDLWVCAAIESKGQNFLITHRLVCRRAMNS